MACCDIAIASTEASFCLSETKIGLIPAVISPYVIAAIGERQAHRYFLTAERFSAAEAHKIGLVHLVAEEIELANTKQQMIKQLLSNSPAAITAAKDLIATVANQDISHNLITETAKRIAEIRTSPEGQEGLMAFLEKRQPKWAQE